MASTVGTIAIGRAVQRVEGRDKVTGAAVYSADVVPPNTLWTAVVVSPVPHARIVEIDTRRATAVSGVRLVLTGRDVGPTLMGRFLHDQPLLCQDRVRFAGDKVAIIAADDPDAAEEAAQLVRVTYEERPAVFDPIAAMQPGAPIIHPDLRSYRGFFTRVPDIPNVHGYRVHDIGDVKAGFEQSDLVVEHTFRTNLGHQGYLEPHASTLAINASDRVEVWASNKVPYNLRKELSDLIDRPEADVVVHPVTVGGDFGSKGGPGDAPLAYHLARMTGRPVKCIASSHEDLIGISHRHPVVVTLRTGVKRDGTILARQAHIIFNSGAYGSHKPVPDGVLNGSNQVSGPYFVPNLHVDAYAVYTNTPPSGYMRGPGHPQVAFSLEAHTDLVARELGMDPLEFRMRNVVKTEQGRDSLAPLVLQRAAEAIGYGEARGGRQEAEGAPTPNPSRLSPSASRLVGRGLAMCRRATGVGEGTSDVTVNPDGTITIVSAMPDNGTGALTVAVQVVAEELGVPVERVRLVRADTDALPVDVGSGASRVTNVAGHAAIAACTLVKEQLAPRAAAMLDASAVRWDRGGWVAEDGRRVSLEDLAVEMIEAGDPAAHAQVTLAQKSNADQGYCAQAAEVEVDLESGQVQVRRLVTVQDVGAIINTLGHQGQIDGGVIQGLGLALTEQLLLADGRVTNGHLSDYKLPTAQDVPPMETIHLSSQGPGPYGARAIGELPYIATAGAITNAVAAATGAKFFEIPLTAESVLAAIEGAGIGGWGSGASALAPCET